MSDGDYVLRVDQLGDIVFLSEDDDRIPGCWRREQAKKGNNAMDLKTRGNACFPASKFRVAIESYLRTKQFDAALADAESATSTPMPSEKAFFRKAQALSSIMRLPRARALHDQGDQDGYSFLCEGAFAHAFVDGERSGGGGSNMTIRIDPEAETAVKLALGRLAPLEYEIEDGAVPGASAATVVVRKWGSFVDSVVDCWMLLRDAYRLVAPDLAAPAERYARIAYRTCFGEDDTFDVTYDNPN
ncbi:hypothetical protein N657DRAFT_631496 [Parathielavia appendiculata]|uniref:Uncharacterized protein n=1 Tax=Parathielavia appendiculata TaxID=2587402 RepID=A0AAN6Z7A8_9PEZI|nr:hypothetical protein N657DRAFT_631496 [Parathielavia appendiculata]